jgi:citrate synthase
MGMFISGLAAMSTFHPEANPALAGSDLYLNDELIRNKQIFRILGKVPTLAANAYRHRIGRPYNVPQHELSYSENFLYMLDHLSEPNYRPNPKLAHALDVLFILHADHELNCSTAAMRHIGSSHVDPYSAVAGASAALYGPLHGGANEAVLRMLESIGTVEAVPDFLTQVKDRKRKLMGFGHRVYKNYDPRAKIIRQIAYEVFDICGREPLIDVAVALEEAALTDPYFVERKLYPNVDFYSGLIYKAMGFPTDMFPVLFAIPRMAGWLAHWVEACKDPSAKIWRPRQVYVGPEKRGYVPVDHRTSADTASDSIQLGTSRHPFSKRSMVATFDGKRDPDGL